MPKPKTYKSDAFAAIHETASDLHDAGLLPKSTMREFDEACLTPIENFTPEEIKAIRRAAGASQKVFALHLNVAPAVISHWETGKRSPSGTSLKLLSLVKRKGLEFIA